MTSHVLAVRSAGYCRNLTLSWLEPEHHSSFLHMNTDVIAIVNVSPSKMWVELIQSISVSVYILDVHTIHKILHNSTLQTVLTEKSNPLQVQIMFPHLCGLPAPCPWVLQQKQSHSWLCCCLRQDQVLYNIVIHHTMSQHVSDLIRSHVRCMSHKCHMPHNAYSPVMSNACCGTCHIS